jgi:hypothetical protein
MATVNFYLDAPYKKGIPITEINRIKKEDR